MDPTKPIHHLVHGVCVVTAKHKEQINGMSVAWVTRISHIPALVSISIQKDCFTREIVDKSGKFCINMLRDGQQEIARNFGSCSGREKDKFQEMNFEINSHDLPILTDALGYISCQVEFCKDLGDHRLYVGSILEENCFCYGEKPLIYHHPDYEDFLG